MAIQELNLKIEYRPGKGNTRADALSRHPVSLLPSDCSETRALEAEPPARRGEESPGDHNVLGERQRA